MLLKEIEISNFRNLDNLKINLSSNFNLFYGANGAGKTSLLESMSLFWNGKSFRTNLLKELVGDNQEQFVLAGKAEVEDIVVPFGMQFTITDKKRLVKYNGENVKKSSELACRLPTLYFSPSSEYLQSGNPQNRRECLFWFLFHVEHEFKFQYETYRKALSSRNALLRKLKGHYIDSNSFVINPEIEVQLDYWESVLVESNIVLGKILYNGLLSVSEKMSLYIKEVGEEKVLSGIGIRSSFLDSEITMEMFKERRQTDIKLGYTGFGFHRVDISFIKNNKKVVGLSRGEEKTLSIIFLLSLLSVVKVHHKGILLLLDDLGAELDKVNIKNLFVILNQLSIQSFITFIDKYTIETFIDLTENYKLFHVKHGSITEEQNVRRK